MSHNFENLKAHILSLSVGAGWEYAKHEWYLESVEHLDKDDPGETCPCSHHPIYELCWLRNACNGAQTFVGNVCVVRFIDASAGRITQGMNRVRRDSANALNDEAILWAHRRGWVNDWERDFLLNTRHKRRLSGRQQAKREEINRVVLARAAAVASVAASLSAARQRDQAVNLRAAAAFRAEVHTR